MRRTLAIIVAGGFAILFRLHLLAIAHEAQVKQVLMNVVLNAIQASREALVATVFRECNEFPTPTKIMAGVTGVPTFTIS
jgi:signal transduction histidine kinase